MGGPTASRRFKLGVGLTAVIVVALAVGAVFLLPPQRSGLPVSDPSVSPTNRTPVPSASLSQSLTPDPPARPTSSASPARGGDPLPELAPVDLRDDSVRKGAVVVSIPTIESVSGEARGPGEVAGPALRLTILISNRGQAPVQLGSVVVNGYRGQERIPLESLTSPGGVPFAGVLDPGQETRGVYLFRVAERDRSDVTFTVDVRAGEPASVFRGDAR